MAATHGDEGSGAAGDPGAALSWRATVATFAVGAVVTVAAYAAVQVLAHDRAPGAVAGDLAPGALAGGLADLARSDLVLVLLVGLALSVVLERLVPLRRQGSPGRTSSLVAQDAAWFLIELAVQVGVAALVYGLALWAKERLGIGVDRLDAVPAAVRFVVAFVAIDLIRYGSHRLRHASPVLWQFHAVHHNQRRLNALTEHRLHPVDLVVHVAIFGLVLAALEVRWEAAAAIAVVGITYTRLYHASTRTSYGPLRHVLVTPQSHRIHHSLDPDHFDTNFGTIFSVWDRLFGTAHPDVTSYPDEGVDDPAFPLGAQSRLRDLPRVIAGQVVHPFVAAGQLVAGRWAPPPAATRDDDAVA